MEVDDGARYRERADRLRAIAAQDSSRKNRELLEQVAREYDAMAREAEARAKDQNVELDETGSNTNAGKRRPAGKAR